MRHRVPLDKLPTSVNLGFLACKTKISPLPGRSACNCLAPSMCSVNHGYSDERDLGPSCKSVFCLCPVLSVSAGLLSEVTSAGGSPGLGSVPS